MKQALQLKLGQQLTLTPQLQQAIKLLQLSTADLQQIIEETLESNALLERESEQPEEEGLDFTEAIAAFSFARSAPSDLRMPIPTPPPI